MTMTVLGALHEAGLEVSEREFAALLTEALRGAVPRGADDPRALLSADHASALASVGADLSPRRQQESEPRAGAVADFVALLAAARPVAFVAQTLGVDASRVRHRLAARQLVGIRQPGGWRLPGYQFGDDGQPLPGLEVVLRDLPRDVHPLVLHRWFTTPQPELALGGTLLSARQWLQAGGDPARVASLATALDWLP